MMSDASAGPTSKHSRFRMRALVVRTAGLLLVGAVTTTLVAWTAAALHVDSTRRFETREYVSPDDPERDPESFYYDRDLDECAEWPAPAWAVGAPRGWPAPRVSSRVASPGVDVYWQEAFRNAPAPGADGPFFADGSIEFQAEVVRAGLPFRAFEDVYLEHVHMEFREVARDDPAIQVPDSFPVARMSGNIVPIIPRPLGFAADTVFFAGCFLALGMGYSGIRGVWRGRRGACSGCGYLLEGLALCPECGKRARTIRA